MKNWILFLLFFGLLLESASSCRNPKSKDTIEHKDGDGHEHKDGDGHDHNEGDGNEHQDGEDHNH